MSNYFTFSKTAPNNNNKSSNSSKEAVEDSISNKDPPPNLYTSPIVSPALITAFGLPTLVEYEAPSSAISPSQQQLPQQQRSNAATAEKSSASPSSTSTEFTRINFNSNRKRAQSLPAVAAENLADIDDSPSKASSSKKVLIRRSRQLSKSTTHLLHQKDQQQLHHTVINTVSSYTYRVRAPSKLVTGTDGYSDEHHLLMVQNPDGTYSHANVIDGEPFTNDDILIGDDDDAAGGFGFEGGVLGGRRRGGSKYEAIQMVGSQQFQQNHLDNIVPLDTITQLENDINAETTPTSAASGTHPHNTNNHHVPLPPELLHPQYTETQPPLKLWPLAVLVFYNVSGGPFGIEPSIRAAGNFYAILGFVIFPFVWSLPEALVTAELGSAFQDPSAGVAWVEEAYGERMGSLCGYLNWVSGATDNAIYPTLFLEYVTSVVGWDKDEFGGWTRFGLVAAITICLSMLNYTGLEIVGKASLVVCAIAMSPFLLMCIIGAPSVVPSRWLQMPEPKTDDGTELFDDDFQTSPGPLPLLGLAGILWRPYMNNMFWNLNSFDAAASFAGETTDVKTTYPRGIFLGLAMTVLFYIVPIMVCVGATDYSQSEWVDGHLGAVAVDIGGAWLGAWTIFAAGITNLALFEAELSADAFQLMGMAERGYLPKIFQKRSKYGTPTTGIIVGTIVIIIFGCADFGQLLELLNANYALSLLMEYAAFVKLRLFRKDLERPYRIPVPDWAAVLIAVPPCVATIAILLISNWYVWVFAVGAVIFGLGCSKVQEIAKVRGWFTYEIKERGYSMPPISVAGESGGTTSDPLSAVADEGEWQHGEENRIT